jgi:hypothetical protein
MRCAASPLRAASARALHTEGDEVIFTVTRPLLLNGIPSTILGRPDLADRAVNVELRPLRQRGEDAELAADFARLRPGLLGLLCDGLTSALRNVATTKIPDPPRMMDACTWAKAAAPGLGIEPGRMAAAWRAHRNQADRAALGRGALRPISRRTVDLGDGGRARTTGRSRGAAAAVKAAPSRALPDGAHARPQMKGSPAARLGCRGMGPSRLPPDYGER